MDIRNTLENPLCNSVDKTNLVKMRGRPFTKSRVVTATSFTPSQNMLSKSDFRNT